MSAVCVRYMHICVGAPTDKMSKIAFIIVHFTRQNHSIPSTLLSPLCHFFDHLEKTTWHENFRSCVHFDCKFCWLDKLYCVCFNRYETVRYMSI
jgi:hypothetical protein